MFVRWTLPKFRTASILRHHLASLMDLHHNCEAKSNTPIGPSHGSFLTDPEVIASIIMQAIKEWT